MLTQEMERLREAVEKDTKSISRAPTDPKRYAIKADNLMKLAKLEGDAVKKGEHYEQALVCYTEAIKLAEGKNPVYFAKRSKLYVETGKTDLAVKDIEAISKLPASEDISGMYVESTVKDIGKLSEVQSTVKLLAERGEIPPELAVALNEHASITAGLVLKVGDHGIILEEQKEHLSEHDKEIEELRAKSSKQQDTIASLVSGNDEMKELVMKLMKQIADVADKTQKNSEQIETIKSKLGNINFELLEKLDANDKLSEAAKKELEEIKNDPCKLSFYHSLIWQMNSLYLASTVIATDMVENQKKGVMGNAGTLLKTVADYTPLVGVGVKLVGEILVSVDKVRESKNVENYSKFVDDSVQMSNLAESVARKLVLSLNMDSIRFEGFSRIANAAQAINDNKVIQTMYNVASSADTATIVGSVYDSVTKGIDNIQEYRASTGDTTVLGYARRFVFGPDEENDPIAKGESKAKIVVKYIAGKIFDGEITGEDLDSKIENIVKQVSEHQSSFTEEAGVNQDESKVAEVKLDKGIEDLEKLIGNERLTKIEQKAAQGAWDKTLLKYGREVEEYLDEAYIKSHFRAVSQEEVDNVRIAMFKHICMGIDSNNNRDLKCAEKFAETYSDIVVKIATQTPDLFINALIVNASIKDAGLKAEVISKLNPIATTLMVCGMEYDDPEAISDLYQKYHNHHVDPLISDLIDLLGNVQLSSHTGNFGDSGDC